MPGLALLRQADTSKDGVVTREEAEAFADREHARLDRNKDGAVDAADFGAMHKELLDYRVKRFAHGFGAGPDARITREQFQAKAAERFARMDYNNDSTISRDERPGWGHGRSGGHKGGRMMGDGDMDGAMDGAGKGPRRGGHGPGPGPGPAESPPAKN